MVQPQPNSNTSNVNQSQSAFNFTVPTSVQNGLGILSNGFGSYQLYNQGKTGQAAFQLAATIPNLQQTFPQTFDPNSYKDPTNKQLINGVNVAGQVGLAGTNAYGLAQNFQSGDYSNAFLNAQGLTAQGQQLGFIPDFTQQIGEQTGLPAATYGGKNPQTGYAPYATGVLGAYNTFNNIRDKNYLGAAVSGAQTYQAGRQVYDAFQAANTATAGAQTGSSLMNGISDIGGYAGAALAVYNMGRTAFGDGTAAQKAQATKMQAEDAVAAYYTAGISSLVQLADNKLLGGQINKFRVKADNFQNSTAGMILNPTGFVTNKALEGAFRAVGSKKGEYQLTRDQYRKVARENKILDENNQMTLADGTKFDAGADGSKLKFDDIKDLPGAGDAVAIADTITAGLGMKGKQREALSLLFAKAALSGKDEKRNLQGIAKQHGLDGNKIQESLDKQLADGDIKKEEYDVWSAKAKDVFGAAGKKPATQAPRPPTIQGLDKIPKGQYYGPDGKPAKGIDPGFSRENIFVPEGSTFDAESKKRTKDPTMELFNAKVTGAEKVNQNRAMGKLPTDGLSAEEIKQLHKDMIKGLR